MAQQAKRAGIVDDLVIEDLLLEVDPDLEDEPEGCIDALSAQVRPALDKAVEAFRLVANVRNGEALFRRFIDNMLAAT